MIPPDVASSLRLILPDQQAATNAQTLPVVAAQKIADVLSNLVPGQRVLAEIQALLPNGNYRAIVGQRDITLALPFSAKAGDSIELEVTESDGKLTLAFVTNKTDNAAFKAGQESVPTTLSSTGKLIGDLMSGIDGEGKRAPAAQLNGNQALVESMPRSASDLVPVLKQALTQSGMFYEAHQARWVAGQLPTEALRQEPQAKYSPSPIPVTVYDVSEGKNLNGTKPDLAPPNTPAVSNTDKGTTQNDQAIATNSRTNNSATRNDQALTTHSSMDKGATRNDQALTTNSRNDPNAQTIPNNTQAGNPIPRELTPLVQQQLDGLATQNFAWQGQVWPGQQMRWEIGENGENARNLDGEPMAQWQTRLKLSLPMLGGIDATLHLRAGGEVGITVSTESETSEIRLKDSAEQLRKQFEAAGLNLTKLLVQHDRPVE
ncbi:MAG: flagellar hook-length control protein FliK [Azonexus sp.]